MNDLSLDIANKLDVLIRLVAVGLCGDRNQKDKIAILDMAGLQPKVIAELLGTTSNTVSVQLSGLRKERKSSSEGRKKKVEAIGDE